jgi:hypothetical protein
MAAGPANLIPPDRVATTKVIESETAGTVKEVNGVPLCHQEPGNQDTTPGSFFSEIGNLKGARTSLSQAQNLSCGKETVTLAVLEGVICPAAELRAKGTWDFPIAVLLVTGRPTVAILREFSAQPAVLNLEQRQFLYGRPVSSLEFHAQCLNLPRL